ncbi:hypothetical protein [Microvirga makkahensis]|nr:hypothetical protein [Microvirga makkahensis]
MSTKLNRAEFSGGGLAWISRCHLHDLKLSLNQRSQVGLAGGVLVGGR